MSTRTSRPRCVSSATLEDTICRFLCRVMLDAVGFFSTDSNEVHLVCTPRSLSMSADPSVPVRENVVTTGRNVVQPMYEMKGGEAAIKISSDNDQPTAHVANQFDVPPYRKTIHKKHPCASANEELFKCSLACPPDAVLCDRATLCWRERQTLQKCFVTNKKWTPPPPAPWWQFWDR